MRHTQISIIALATEVLMVLTKRKLRPDGFQTVEPPGSLAMPIYSCFSNSCTFTDCEIYKWYVHRLRGLKQNNIPKLGLLGDIKHLSMSTQTDLSLPLSLLWESPFFLLSLCNYENQFFFTFMLQRKKHTIAFCYVYSGEKICSLGKRSHLEPVNEFRMRLSGQQRKNIVIACVAPRNSTETWNLKLHRNTAKIIY